MATKTAKPVNLAPGDFGSSAEAKHLERQAEERNAAAVGPTPDQVQALHDTAKLADQQRLPIGLKEEAPADPAAPLTMRRWRVSVEGVKSRVVPEADRMAVMQDYLDVEAPSEWEAVKAFAKHNGIPLARDPMTGKEKIASIHQPHVELVS